MTDDNSKNVLMERYLIELIFLYYAEKNKNHVEFPWKILND